MRPSEFKDIRYDKDETTGVVVVTLNRPERKNALTAYSFLELWWAADTFGKDDTATAMVLTGNGTNSKKDPTKEPFCSGGYFNFSQNPPLADDAWLDEETKAQMDLTDIAQKKLTLKMWELDKPVIAAINGYAVGAGFTLPLSCADLIYASEHAWAQIPFVSLGIIPEFASSYILPRLMGFQRAKEMMFFGKPIPARELADMGLINQVLPHETLMDHVMKKTCALIPPNGAGMAVKLCKQAIHKPLLHNFSTALDIENKGLNKVLVTWDFKEAVLARMEHRSPVFIGK
ncbi:2-(1,2-epoxy-1,2-dihydrophenyl)acetyl-CoA isomerase [Desulfocicer vacuolatum DSM 3385]|uniref:2-(1,2-epoxy-1,2-dihydrophenyl)acetyl-CoA isomerase n=1 Tax=Desulfocicer vacuolatum DSM 3385 TaxID=1121400 RepID=A0A1W2EJ65_9BACT|nr:enoyl-CoA hydratase-related protein [Desulfocicer vacuolatum]SMD09724.1 2-(1,2-epoxy-1,2-dihydrophenyl)acetyl-CoA isomerase [Desulfocicer vacuolatum DSM 3385]